MPQEPEHGALRPVPTMEEGMDADRETGRPGVIPAPIGLNPVQRTKVPIPSSSRQSPSLTTRQAMR